MNVFWSEFASLQVQNIHQYYKTVAGYKIANKIKNKIFDATRQLKAHPLSGQLEHHLEHFNEGHRYLISGNYKIIYKPVKEGILITDIFDARQDPQKMKI